jgi:hypothetical protein
MLMSVNSVLVSVAQIRVLIAHVFARHLYIYPALYIVPWILHDQQRMAVIQTNGSKCRLK